MSRPRLTDRFIASLASPTPPQRQLDHWDAGMRGFGVRVSYGGKKVFVVRYRVGGRLRRLTLGPYPDLSLADARRKARIVLGDVAHGDDPAEDKQARREAETFKGLAKAYLEFAEERHRSWKEAKRIIDKDLLPLFGPRLLVDIRRRDVRELVEAITRRRKAPVMANRTLSLLSRMFNFALDREWIEASPAARIPEPGQEQSRERVLSDDELRELWERLETIAQQNDAVDDASEASEIERVPQITRATAQAFQVQLLTAQRPGEVRAMMWAHVDLQVGWWTIPAASAKNGRPHRVPLTATVIEILEERQKNTGEKARFVFENRAGLGSVVHRGKKAAAVLCKSLTFHFRAHDLRRTAATRMAEAGVSRDHIAKVLNHVETGPSATRVYDRYDYDAEKRDAVERWARRLEAIIAGRTGKVVAMHGR